jgi:cytidyltransferase-like protein
MMRRPTPGKMKSVLVSGCFDLLHAGHIAFLREAASFGRLFVCIGSDKNIQELKGRLPEFSQDERLYIIKAIDAVEDAWIASGSGILDFEPDLKRIKPDFFIVNRDGHTTEKEALCRKHEVVYKVLERIPPENLPARSSSAIKKEMRFPFRIALAGGWIDQPWVSRLHSGSMVVASLKPVIRFHDRSGMATSSRKKAIEIWGDRVPEGDPVRLAKILFGAENPPGSVYVSGSQDHLGLLLPGINRLHYNGGFWPDRITSILDPETVEWLERVLQLVPLKPRPKGYDPIRKKNLTVPWVGRLGQSGEACWKSIRKHDAKGLGESLSESLECWRNLLPLTVNRASLSEMNKYPSALGGTFSGSRGGYLILVSEERINHSLSVKIRI